MEFAKPLYARQPVELIVRSDCFFRLADMERYADGAYGTGRFSMQSGAFSLHDCRFSFDGLDRFLDDMRGLYETLSGSATLRNPYDACFLLSLAALPRGYIEVTGTVEEPNYDYDILQKQRLEFGFTIDQTFLPPFLRSLEAACRDLYPTAE